MWIATVILYIVSVIFATLSRLTLKNEKLDISAACFALAAALFATIAISGGDTVSGAYEYYVNGVKMDSGLMAIGQDFALWMLIAAFCSLTSRGFSFLVAGLIHGKSSKASQPFTPVQEYSAPKQFNKFTAFLQGFGIWLGMVLFGAGLTLLSDSIVLGVIFILCGAGLAALCLRGLIRNLKLRNK